MFKKVGSSHQWNYLSKAKLSDNISILTKQRLDDFLGKKYLGTKKMDNNIIENYDNLNNPRMNVYGHLEYIGRLGYYYVYDFYYSFNGENINTINKESDIPLYLIMNYNIRDCTLTDSNGDEYELNKDNYFIEINGSIDINKSSYKNNNICYSYKLVDSKNEDSYLSETKNIGELINNLINKKDLGSLNEVKDDYLETKCFNAKISLSSIPSNIFVNDYLESKLKAELN